MTNELEQTKLYRPTYTMGKDQMTVTFYDGKKYRKMVLENKYREHKVAQELVKFFSQNATKNDGKIPSGEMISAWLSAQEFLPVTENDIKRDWNSPEQRAVIRTEKINYLDNMIKTACLDISEGGSDVIQKEQFAILKALASWFIDLDKKH